MFKCNDMPPFDCLSSIVVGGLSALVQTELSTQNYQQKSNYAD